MTLLFLTATQVAKRWESAGITGQKEKPISTKTLSHWRWSSKGPSYKTIHGMVRYQIEDLRTYERETFGTTCDPQPGADNDNKDEKIARRTAA